MSKRHSNDDLDVCSAGTLPTKTIRWLVPNVFALGQLTIIDGDPGLGKSLLMLDLAARLSTGRAWPDGAPATDDPASTIYLSAEDGDDILVPRLQALAHDLGRVFLYRSKDRLLEHPLSFPANIGFLDRALAETAARLIVIDPVVAFLDPGILAGSDEGIRRALYPLAKLAQEHHCAIVLIRHLNKRAGARSLYRGGGSIGFIAHCRSAWLVGREPAHNSLPFAPTPSPAPSTDRPAQAPSPTASDQPSVPTRCVLAQQKNNNGPLQPSLLYQIVGNEAGCPTIDWLGPCPLTPDALVALPPRIEVKPRGRAIRFLKHFLAAGPVCTQDIWDAALELNLFERTLRRAKNDLGIKDKVAWVNGSRRCFWMLSQHDISDPPSTDPDVLAFEQHLAAMCKKYPPSTPLDDRDAYTPPEPVELAETAAKETPHQSGEPLLKDPLSPATVENEYPPGDQHEEPTSLVSPESPPPATAPAQPAIASPSPLSIATPVTPATPPPPATPDMPPPDAANPPAAEPIPRFPPHAAWLENLMRPHTIPD